MVKKWDSEEDFCYSGNDLYFPVPSNVLNLNGLFYFAWVLIIFHLIITLMVMQIKLVRIVAIMYIDITYSFNSCTAK
jgi:hypothetical protein